MTAVYWTRYGKLTAVHKTIIVSLSVLLQVSAVYSMTANFLEDGMKVKSGVKLTGLQPELIIGLIVCKSVYDKFGFELVITSGLEGNHSRKSLHYTGQAVDLRTRSMSKSTQERVIYEIRKRLTEDFDVVLEATHIHIEYQPKNNA